jgi:hypothetical protein
MDSSTSHLALIWMVCNLAEENGDSSAIPERQTNRPGAAQPAVDGGFRPIPIDHEQSVFWSQPGRKSSLRKRRLFDNQGNVPPGYLRLCSFPSVTLAARGE